MTKVQITEEMHDKWVSELHLITPGSNAEDWKFKFVLRDVFLVLVLQLEAMLFFLMHFQLR